MWQEYVKTFCDEAKIRLQFKSGQFAPYADVGKRLIVCPVKVPKDMETGIGTIIKHEVGHLIFTKGEATTMANAIEDIRIERELGKRFYGIAKDFKAERENISNKIMEKLKDGGELPVNKMTIALLISDYLFSGSDRFMKLLPIEAQEVFKKYAEVIKSLFIRAKHTRDINEIAKFINRVFELPFDDDSKDDIEKSGGMGKSGEVPDDTKKLMKQFIDMQGEMDEKIRKAPISYIYDPDSEPYNYKLILDVREDT